MKLLIVKMSSMGDVIHTLPAVTDASRAVPDLSIDWVVEAPFADIPAFHPAVDDVIPIALRQWRRRPFAAREAFRDFVGRLRSRRYDLVLDAQGLIKSAVVAQLARGPRAGFDRPSAREPLSVTGSRDRFPVPRQAHAVARLRQLFAAALGYGLPADPVDYGLTQSDGEAPRPMEILLLHGTTWPSKHWPEAWWIDLARIISRAGYTAVVPAGSDIERDRARRIAEAAPAVILDRLPLPALRDRMRQCRGVVSVDSGLGHLATALNLPLVGLYGATDPALTGFEGPTQAVLASDHLPCIPCLDRTCQFPPTRDQPHPPCFAPLDPDTVWRRLELML